MRRVSQTSLSHAALRLRWDDISFPCDQLPLQLARCRKTPGTFHSLLDDVSSRSLSGAVRDRVRNQLKFRWKSASSGSSVPKSRYPRNLIGSYTIRVSSDRKNRIHNKING